LPRGDLELWGVDKVDVTMASIVTNPLHRCRPLSRAARI
jgi:hypothetical protein